MDKQLAAEKFIKLLEIVETLRGPLFPISPISSEKSSLVSQSLIRGKQGGMGSYHFSASQNLRK